MQLLGMCISIIYTYVYILYIYIYYPSMSSISYIQKHPTGPEIGQAFSSIVMFIVIFVVLLKTWHLPHIYVMVVSFGTSCPLGFMKNHCFIAVGIQKCMLDTLKKRYVLWMVLCFGTAPAILFHHFNLHNMKCVHRIQTDVRNEA